MNIEEHIFATRVHHILTLYYFTFIGYCCCEQYDQIKCSTFNVKICLF